MKRLIVFPIILAVAGLSIGGKSKWRVVPRPEESVASPQPEVISAAGTIETATEEINVSAQIPGLLRNVPVHDGERLRKGQTIAVLENTEFRARVAEAEATVKEREAGLERLVNGARREERREAEIAAEEARVVLATTSDELARKQKLFEYGVASRVELERAKSDYDVADARLKQASERSSSINAPARPEEVAQAQARLDLARAQLLERRAQLDNTIVRAPLDGTVLKRLRQTGETVNGRSDDAIVSFGDNSRLRVRVEVDESDIAKLHLGARAYFTAQAFGDRKFWGRVIQIGQELGKKRFNTEQPGEKIDTKVLEALVELDSHAALPPGLRVDSFLLVEAR
jgi:multidrug resistance efflux pump